MKIFLICFFCFIVDLHASFLNEGPWGKDSDLKHPSQNLCSATCYKTLRPKPFFGLFAERMIQFHQEVISPADGPRSHYIPSSSQYTLEAIQKYGFFCGVTMGCDRLMRENDETWVYRLTRDSAGHVTKYDPVP